jgi:hypothetical protein
MTILVVGGSRRECIGYNIFVQFIDCNNNLHTVVHAAIGDEPSIFDDEASRIFVENLYRNEFISGFWFEVDCVNIDECVRTANLLGFI